MTYLRKLGQVRSSWQSMYYVWRVLWVLVTKKTVAVASTVDFRQKSTSMTSRPMSRKSAPLSVVRGVADRSFSAGRRRSMFFPDVLISSRMESSTCLYRRDLRAHYGCVNAIEFSAGDGHMIASGSESVRNFGEILKSDFCSISSEILIQDYSQLSIISFCHHLDSAPQPVVVDDILSQHPLC